MSGHLQHRSQLSHYAARDAIRKILRENAGDGLDLRHPSLNTKRVVRKTLESIGPHHQHHSDGWEKIGASALDMGNVGIPAYVIKDQFSSRILLLQAVPNDRHQETIAHLYLDCVTSCGGKRSHLSF